MRTCTCFFNSFMESKYEQSEEGSHEILQPFGLQDEQSERNTKDIATAQLNSAESDASAA